MNIGKSDILCCTKNNKLDKSYDCWGHVAVPQSMKPDINYYKSKIVSDFILLIWKWK